MQQLVLFIHLYILNISYRLKLKDDAEKRPKVKQAKKEETEFVEEMDSDEENEVTKIKTETSIKDNGINEIKSIENEPEKEKKDSKNDSKEIIKLENKEKAVKRVFGPMRPPDDYEVPEGYFDQETDRDLPEIEEKE